MFFNDSNHLSDKENDEIYQRDKIIFRTEDDNLSQINDKSSVSNLFSNFIAFLFGSTVFLLLTDKNKTDTNKCSSIGRL